MESTIHLDITPIWSLSSKTYEILNKTINVGDFNAQFDTVGYKDKNKAGKKN